MKNKTFPVSTLLSAALIISSHAEPFRPSPDDAVLKSVQIAQASASSAPAPGPKAPPWRTNNFQPYLLTGKATYDGQPALARGTDGTLWAAWVSYKKDEGDSLMVAIRKNGAWLSPEPVSTARQQIIRPTLAVVGDSVCAAWTETGGDVSRVLFSIHKKNSWTKPEQLNPSGVSAQNQEMAVDSKGVLRVVWQEFHRGQYDIVLRSYENGKWAKPSEVTSDANDDWDPAIVSDAVSGTWAAWTSFRDGDYDLYMRRLDAPGEKEIRLSARGDYDLHPSLASDQQGHIWVAWDSVHVPWHGSSGRSTITGANLKKFREEFADPEKGGQQPTGHIRLACLDHGTLRELIGASESLKPPGQFTIAHTAMPKVEVDAQGAVWIAYRALGHAQNTNANAKPGPGAKAAANNGNGNGANKPAGPNAKKPQPNRWGPYWWDMFVQSNQGGDWSFPQMIPQSDGTLEEPAVIPDGSGVLVAYEMEHRRKFSQTLSGFPDENEDDESHHNDFGQVLGFNGDVYVAHVSRPGSAKSGGAATALAERPAPVDRPVPPRVPRSDAHYSAEVGGHKYQLLWGDLHKHSNVSRCSSGNEPTPDDHYKYSHDICQYDFLAMSDHSEHTSDFNWWRLQKLADLYNVPGSFSVLYGYEWSARWPVGHHNVVFAERPTPILRSSIAGTKDTKGLWEALEKSGKKALTVPHTLADPGMGTRWDIHDDRYERVAEIFQACRGSYEYDGCPRQHVNATATNCFFQDGLAKGYKLGVICSSDHGWGTAYAVVYATENTRQGAFKGMMDRRTYGSTTYGLIVDFRAGDHLMGEEFSSRKPVPIKIYTRGTAPIRQVDVFSQGKLVKSWGSPEKPLDQREARLEWTPESLSSGTTYYYVRVIQTDDEMAWTSPVWISAK